MKRKVFLVVGAYLILNIIYKIYRCHHCSEEIFTYEVSGTTDILINAVLAIVLFYGAYRERAIK